MTYVCWQYSGLMARYGTCPAVSKTRRVTEPFDVTRIGFGNAAPIVQVELTGRQSPFPNPDKMVVGETQCIVKR
jgi:hypothetical protein